jgi:hypothetical protein
MNTTFQYETRREGNTCRAYVSGRITLKCSLKKWDIQIRTGLMWPRNESVMSICESGNDTSGCTEGEELLDQLTDYCFLQNCEISMDSVELEKQQRQVSHWYHYVSKPYWHIWKHKHISVCMKSTGNIPNLLYTIYGLLYKFTAIWMHLQILTIPYQRDGAGYVPLSPNRRRLYSDRIVPCTWKKTDRKYTRTQDTSLLCTD